MKENNKDMLPMPKIFQHNKVNTSNQQEYRKNYLTEILKQQEETNTSITSTVIDINRNLQQGLTDQEKNYQQLLEKLSLQDSNFMHVTTKLNVHEDYHQQLSDKINAHAEFHQEVADKINAHAEYHQEISKKIDVQDNNQQIIHEQLMIQKRKSDDFLESLLSTETSTMEIEQRLDKLEILVEEEKLLSQATIDQLAFQEDMTRGIHTKLEKYEDLYEDIQSRIAEQEHFYHEINDKLQIQEMFHQSIMNRLDSQDETSQKLVNQLDMVRQTLVERLEAAILSIDSKYKQTLQYLSGMVGLKERIIQKPTSQENANKELVKVEAKQE